MDYSVVVFFCTSELFKKKEGNKNNQFRSFKNINKTFFFIFIKDFYFDKDDACYRHSGH